MYTSYKHIIICILFTQLSYSQDADAYKLCLAFAGSNYNSNSVAEIALNRILNTVAISRNFVLYPCENTSNAAAFTYKGDRYIFYNVDFMKRVNQYSDDWSNLFVLAHEVGHHVNGHTRDLVLYANDLVHKKSLFKDRQEELQADKFAGFVLGKLGANFSSIRSVLSSIAPTGDDSQSTHPNRSKRINAAYSGFQKGAESYQPTRNKINSNDSSKRNTSSNKQANPLRPKSKFINAPRSFWYNEKRYQSYTFTYYWKDGIKSEIGILENGGGLLRVSSDDYAKIKGTISFYLNDGKIIKCYDRGLYEKIDNKFISYYYLTFNELKHLLKSNIKVDELRYYKKGELRSDRDPVIFDTSYKRDIKKSIGLFESNYDSKAKSSKSTITQNQNKLPKAQEKSTLSKNQDKTSKTLENSESNFPLSTPKERTPEKKTKPSQKNYRKIDYKSPTYTKVSRKIYKKNNGIAIGAGILLGEMKSIREMTGLGLEFAPEKIENYYPYSLISQLDFYFNSVSLGFRYSNYSYGGDYQGLIGYEVDKNIYMKVAIGSSYSDLDFDTFIDYTSYSFGFSYFKNTKGINLIPEVFINLNTGFAGIIFSAAF